MPLGATALRILFYVFFKLNCLQQLETSGIKARLAGWVWWDKSRRWQLG
jgi:hypothetical protein